MSVARFSVKNYQFTVVLFVMAALIGVSAFRSVPRAEDPSFPIPIFTVVAVYPGASPGDVEQLVVDPVEERINELDDLKKVDTRVNDGLAVMRVEFDADVDADDKYEEVLRQINAVRPELPADLYSLDVNKANSSEVNVVQVALVSETAPYRDLADLAERLEDRLETVAGVKEAETHAYPEREVRVSVDLGRLAQLRIPVGQVIAAIQSDNANVPGGAVDVGRRRFSVKTSGTYASLEQVQGTVLRAADGRLVLLRDVAEVAWGYAEEAYVGRYNGRRAVFVTANMKDGQNIAAVRPALWAELDRFERAVPKTVAVERGFDQAENVSRRLSRLGVDFAIAILLVLVTLLPLGLRAAVIVMISIPLSLAIGLSLLSFAGYTLNQLSIVGFVIALGLLVDDSIVVIENIARFLREGATRREAAIKATEQIGAAVLGCTATLIFAFVPLLVLPGAAGDYIRSMPLAVIFTVLASLVVSLTIIPFLASLVLKEETGAHAAEGNRQVAEGNVFLRALNRAIQRTYAPVLHRALARPKTTVAAAGLLFVGSVLLVPAVGFSLFPKAGLPQFRVTVETPDGSALAETDRAARLAEAALVGHPSVRAVMTNVGHGNPQVYYNVTPAEERSNVGELFVTLGAYDEARTPVWLDSLRRRFAAYPNARIEVKEYENGPPIDAPIAMRLTGENLDTLRTLAARVESLLVSTAGTMYVNNPVRVNRTDLRVEVDAAKAGLFGVSPAEVDRTVRLALAGLPAGNFREADGDEYAITVRSPAQGAGGRQAVEALDGVYVSASGGGAAVPLRQVARVRFAASPPTIQHYDRERAVTVSAYVQTGYNTDRLTKQTMAALDAWAWPAGYGYTPGGEYESRQESFGGLGTAVIVTVFGILAILVLEFRTFRSTLIVASVIPLGVVGGIVALLLTGYTFSFMAVIGFVALTGIEIKNSILLVDFTNQLRAEGRGLDEAVEEAGRVRFLPIVLTTMTAIGGLLPLALQRSSLYSPLAWVIIGGLVSSTVLARLVTPVMYKLLAPAVEPAGAASPGDDGRAGAPVGVPVPA